MKTQINISKKNFKIRSAEDFDLEILRNAKNKNKKSFFLKSDITQEQQKKWFLALKEKADDFMLICEEVISGQIFGCMGFRILDGVIDGYNIIRIQKIPNTSMEEAFIAMIKQAKKMYPGLTFQVRVLSDNPAVLWYTRIGFEKVSEETNFITLYYNKK